MAWPELLPGAGEPSILIERNKLKRLMMLGPIVRFTEKNSDKGICSPEALLT